jgi:hypothetical protein
MYKNIMRLLLTLEVNKTQLAATSELSGEDAQRLIDSLKKKPTEKSRENGKRLKDYFDKYAKL